MSFIEFNSILSDSNSNSDVSILKTRESENNKCLISDADYKEFLLQLDSDLKLNISGVCDPSWPPLVQSTHFQEYESQSLYYSSHNLLQEMDFKLMPSFWGSEVDFTQSSDLPEMHPQIVQVKKNSGSKFDREAFWTEDNVSKLLVWAEKYHQEWKRIAKLFGMKQITPSRVRDKYREIKANELPLRIPFSHEEDCLIAKYYNIYRFDWKKIASHLPKRNHIMVKNRFYSHIRKHSLLESLLEEVASQESNAF